MALAQRYYEALLLCEDLEQRGLVNLIMPESNLLLSDKLQGSERRQAIDAINIYVRAYRLLGKATFLVGLTSLVLAANLLLKTLA